MIKINRGMFYIEKKKEKNPHISSEQYQKQKETYSTGTMRQQSAICKYILKHLDHVHL